MLVLEHLRFFPSPPWFRLSAPPARVVCNSHPTAPHIQSLTSGLYDIVHMATSSLSIPTSLCLSENLWRLKYNMTSSKKSSLNPLLEYPFSLDVLSTALNTFTLQSIYLFSYLLCYIIGSLKEKYRSDLLYFWLMDQWYRECVCSAYKCINMCSTAGVWRYQNSKPVFFTDGFWVNIHPVLWELLGNRRNGCHPGNWALRDKLLSIQEVCHWWRDKNIHIDLSVTDSATSFLFFRTFTSNESGEPLQSQGRAAMHRPRFSPSKI